MPNAVVIALFEHKAWANRELVRALDDAAKTVAKADLALALFTFGHASIVDRIFKARLGGEPPDFASVIDARTPRIADLAETTAATDAWYLDYVRRAPDEELERTVDFTFIADGDAGCMTKAEILAHVITHAAAHRGAISKMLEALARPSPPDMMTTFVGARAGAAER